MYLNHMSEHFKHRCSLCGYMTSYAGRLKRHHEDCHMTDDQRPVNTQRKPALKRCRKCGFESTNLVRFAGNNIVLVNWDATYDVATFIENCFADFSVNLLAIFCKFQFMVINLAF